MAKHIKPNVVVESVLFQSVAPYIDSISNAQLVYELCRASQQTHVMLNDDNLDDAFTWANSPQGEFYWEALNDECHEHPDWN